MRHRARSPIAPSCASVVACVVLALSFGLVLLLPLAPPASAATAPTVLQPGVVEQLPAPGMPLVTPADGRLRGPAFSAEVTGVAWPGSAVPVTPADLVPAHGDRLVVFGLRLTEPTGVAGASGSSGIAGVSGPAAGVTASLTYGPSAASVPLGGIENEIGQLSNSDATGTGTFVAAVPLLEHHVDLVLSEAGFSQSFSLWTLMRVPPSPALLYRDPSATIISAATSPGGRLELFDEAAGFHETDSLTTDVAELSYFVPSGGGATASAPSEAELVVQLEADIPGSEYPNGNYFQASSPLAGAHLSLTVPGQPVVHATSSAMLDTPQSLVLDDRLLDATYSFVVPADVTRATLEIAGGPTPGTGYEAASSLPSTVEVTSATPLLFRFPPPSPPARQVAVRWVAAGSLASVATTTHHIAMPAPSSGGLPWPLLVALVLVMASVVAWAIRRGPARRLFGDLRRRLRARITATTGLPQHAAHAGNQLAHDDEHVPEKEGAPMDPAPQIAVGDLRPVRPASEGPKVHVLGTVEVTGWKERPNRRIVEELCCYLALHPERGKSPEDLLSALWPVSAEAKEANRATLHTYVSMLRRAVGANHVPDASGADGYRVIDVASDWADFCDLVSRTRLASPEEAIRLRAEALRLVRGRPFSGVDQKRYSWAFAEGLAAQMTAAIVRCAERLGRGLLEAGDPLSAEAAAWAGLRASSDEELLWELLLDAAAAGPARGRLLHALQDAERTLGRARGLELRRRYLRDESLRDNGRRPHRPTPRRTEPAGPTGAAEPPAQRLPER